MRKESLPAETDDWMVGGTLPPSRRSSSAWTAACTVVVDTELVDTKVVAGMEDADEEGVRVMVAEEVAVAMDVPDVPGGMEDAVDIE